MICTKISIRKSGAINCLIYKCYKQILKILVADFSFSFRRFVACRKYREGNTNIFVKLLKIIGYIVWLSYREKHRINLRYVILLLPSSSPVIRDRQRGVVVLFIQHPPCPVPACHRTQEAHNIICSLVVLVGCQSPQIDIAAIYIFFFWRSLDY